MLPHPAIHGDGIHPRCELSASLRKYSACSRVLIRNFYARCPEAANGRRWSASQGVVSDEFATGNGLTSSTAPMISNLFPAGANLASTGEVILWGYVCDPMRLRRRGRGTHAMVATLKRPPPARRQRRSFGCGRRPALGSLWEDLFHLAHDSACQAHLNPAGMVRRMGENILLLFFSLLALVTNVNRSGATVHVDSFIKIEQFDGGGEFPKFAEAVVPWVKFWGVLGDIAAYGA